MKHEEEGEILLHMM